MSGQTHSSVETPNSRFSSSKCPRYSKERMNKRATIVPEHVSRPIQATERRFSGSAVNILSKNELALSSEGITRAHTYSDRPLLEGESILSSPHTQQFNRAIFTELSVSSGESKTYTLATKSLRCPTPNSPPTFRRTRSAPILVPTSDQTGQASGGKAQYADLPILWDEWIEALKFQSSGNVIRAARYLATHFLAEIESVGYVRTWAEGDASAPPKTPTGSSSSRSAPKFSSDSVRKKGKRAMQSSHGDDAADEDNDKKRQRGVSSPLPKEKVEPDLLFACPYTKFDPLQYPNCRRKQLTAYRYVAQHLASDHSCTCCPTCGKEFYGNDRGDECDSHVVSRSCQNVEFFVIGLTERKHERLRTIGRFLRDEQKWFKAWDILFPGRNRPASCYVGTAVVESLCILLEEEPLRRIARSLRDMGFADLYGIQLNDSTSLNYARVIFTSVLNSYEGNSHEVNDHSGALPWINNPPFTSQPSNDLSFEAPDEEASHGMTPEPTVDPSVLATNAESEYGFRAEVEELVPWNAAGGANLQGFSDPA